MRPICGSCDRNPTAFSIPLEVERDKHKPGITHCGRYLDRAIGSKGELIRI